MQLRQHSCVLLGQVDPTTLYFAHWIVMTLLLLSLNEDSGLSFTVSNLLHSIFNDGKSFKHKIKDGRREKYNSDAYEEGES